MSHIENIDKQHFNQVDEDKLNTVGDLSHPPRILLLYGSLREVSYSRLLSESRIT